jgi:hypothetical protein
MRWASHVTAIVHTTNTHRALVGEFLGKRQLGKPRQRCKDNIKLNVKETGREGVDWIWLAQNRNN